MRRGKGGERSMSKKHDCHEHAREHAHSHGHEHEHSHEHCHSHGHRHTHGKALTIRAHSGLSGDIMLAGLMRMTEISAEDFEARLASLMPELAGSVKLVRREVNHIGGWHASVELPHQHEHRTLRDILAIIEKSGLSERGRELSAATFTLLARAEAAGDAVGIFEQNLKLGTVLRVLTSWEAWWQFHAKELPALPPMSAMEELLHE